MSRPTAAQKAREQRRLLDERATLGSAAIPQPIPGVVTLADVAPQRVTWLWPGYVPSGKLVVFDGDPSVGKSTLTNDLAARVSTGSPWPDGSPNGVVGDVLLLSAEDGIADTIVPRLLAAGADLTRVHTLFEVPIVIDEEGTTRMVPPTLPRDVATIEAVVRRYGVKVVVVDVLMAFLNGKVDAHRDQDVRGVLHQLAALAERCGCTIVLIRHMNKAGGTNPLYRGGGSIGIVGAARAAFLVARDPEDNDRRVFACTKMNIAVEPAAMSYRLVSDDELDCARVEWEGVSGHTAASLLAAPIDGDERTEVDEAGDWLRSYLTMGSADRKDIIKAAKAESISLATLKRAAQRIGVKSTRSGYPASARWSMPAAVGPDSQNLEPTEPTEPTDSDQALSNGQNGQQPAQLAHETQMAQMAQLSGSWDNHHGEDF